MSCGALHVMHSASHTLQAHTLQDGAASAAGGGGDDFFMLNSKVVRDKRSQLFHFFGVSALDVVFFACDAGVSGFTIDCPR